MKTDEITYLRSLPTDELELIIQIATHCPSWRIPKKQIDMCSAHRKFDERPADANIADVARELGISNSTAYRWLRDRSVCNGGRSREVLQLPKHKEQRRALAERRR